MTKRWTNGASRTRTGGEYPPPHSLSPVCTRLAPLADRSLSHATFLDVLAPGYSLSWLYRSTTRVFSCDVRKNCKLSLVHGPFYHCIICIYIYRSVTCGQVVQSVHLGKRVETEHAKCIKVKVKYVYEPSGPSGRRLSPVSVA